MTKPNECKWCGCGSVYSVSDRHVKFTCRSAWTADGDCWACSSQCCDGMRDRIQRAVEVLDYITVEDWEERSRDAFEILRGNSPESPDSSPVTADQLATEDYYEAVRQRVPWMTSVQHIEELVEGYRKCGLMVWRAAEQIKLIFGGGNDEAE